MVWLRELRPGGSAAALNRDVCRGLYAMGLLVRYCDVDKQGAEGHVIGEGESGAEAEEEEEEEGDAPGAKARAAPRSKGSKGGGGRRASGGKAAAAAPLPAVPPPADELPRGGTVARVHELLRSHAFASLRLAAASHKLLLSQAAKVEDASARAAAPRLSSAAREAAAAAVGVATEGMQKVRPSLESFSRLAAKALRGCGFVYARAPRLLLESSVRVDIVEPALASQNPVVIEAALHMFRDLLSACDARAATARALELRRAIDARKAVALLAAGYEVDEKLLASAAGLAFAAALGRPSFTIGAGDEAIAEAASARLGDAAGGQVTTIRADGSRVVAKRGVVGDRDAEASVITGVVQAHVGALVAALAFAPTAADAAADPSSVRASVGTRRAAVELLGTIIAQGAQAPDDCVAPLVASCCDESSIAAVALSHLLRLSDKYPTRVELHAAEGVVKSYFFQVRLRRRAAAAAAGMRRVLTPPPPLSRLQVFVFGSASPVAAVAEAEDVDGAVKRSLLGPFYSSCVARHPNFTGPGLSRARLAFLRGLVARIIPETIPGLHEKPSGGDRAGRGQLGALLAQGKAGVGAGAKGGHWCGACSGP